MTTTISRLEAVAAQVARGLLASEGYTATIYGTDSFGKPNFGSVEQADATIAKTSVRIAKAILNECDKNIKPQ